jgi:hypothetical protein
MHWHYPLALAAPLGCLLAFLGLGTVAGVVRMVSRTSARPRKAAAMEAAVPQEPQPSQLGRD